MGIIPACAGSTPRQRSGHLHHGDHPRMCGEHITPNPFANAVLGSSPHVRGAQNLLPIMQDLDGIIPACAGSTCARLSARLEHGDHPRMCGEHRISVNTVSSSAGSSPHVRGARSALLVAPCVPGIIPACAGSTKGAFGIQGRHWDHPRMCGEHLYMP